MYGVQMKGYVHTGDEIRGKGSRWQNAVPCGLGANGRARSAKRGNASRWDLQHVR